MSNGNELSIDDGLSKGEVLKLTNDDRLKTVETPEVSKLELPLERPLLSCELDVTADPRVI